MCIKDLRKRKRCYGCEKNMNWYPTCRVYNRKKRDCRPWVFSSYWRAVRHCKEFVEKDIVRELIEQKSW